MPKKPAIDDLRERVAAVGADPDLTDDDHRRVDDHLAAVVERIKTEKRWRTTAHVHAAVHISDDDPDLDTFICHDCGRGLVSDAGTERLLICPKLHGRRPPELRSTGDGAVECGQPGGPTDG